MSLTPQEEERETNAAKLEALADQVRRGDPIAYCFCHGDPRGLWHWVSTVDVGTYGMVAMMQMQLLAKLNGTMRPLA